MTQRRLYKSAEHNAEAFPGLLRESRTTGSPKIIHHCHCRVKHGIACLIAVYKMTGIVLGITFSLPLSPRIRNNVSVSSSNGLVDKTTVFSLFSKPCW